MTGSATGTGAKTGRETKTGQDEDGAGARGADGRLPAVVVVGTWNEHVGVPIVEGFLGELTNPIPVAVR